MAYGTELQEILGRGYGEIGTPWRIAEERKTVGIGECCLWLRRVGMCVVNGGRETRLEEYT